MKSLHLSLIVTLFLFLISCGDDGAGADFQSDRCNSGQQATLTLNIDGVGNFTYMESSKSISHASDSEGLGIDAISMYMHWKDAATGDSLIFDVTVENETLAETTYNLNPSDLNGTVYFYIYNGGVLQDWYRFNNWETTINEYEVYTTTSAGGLTSTRLAFVDAVTSGVLLRDGVLTTHSFTANYTICPKY